MNKKPFLILTGTIAGTVGVLSYAPSSQASAPTLTQTAAATATTKASSTATKSSAASTSVKQVATRTIKGAVSQTQFGPVQVQVTLKGQKIIAIKALQTPQGGRSSWINQQAVPYLVEQTLAAQSASIQGVGGATYTTEGWITSLQSALSK